MHISTKKRVQIISLRNKTITLHSIIFQQVLFEAHRNGVFGHCFSSTHPLEDAGIQLCMTPKSHQLGVQNRRRFIMVSSPDPSWNQVMVHMDMNMFNMIYI